MFQLPNFFPEAKPGIIIGGFCLLFAVLVFTIWRGIIREKAKSTVTSEVDAARSANDTAVRYGFGPLAALTLDLQEAYSTENDRLIALKRVADRAAEALAIYLLRHDDLRANVFQITEDQALLEMIGHGGAREPAGDFRTDRDAGKRNLDWILDGGSPRVIADMRKGAPPDADPNHRGGYLSYVSVTISSKQYGYGMLSVDSPEAEIFTDADVEMIKVISRELAIAFAIVYSSPATASPETVAAPKNTVSIIEPDGAASPAPSLSGQKHQNDSGKI